MPSYKVGRVAEDIKRELAYIIREIKDPRVTGILLSLIHISEPTRPY